MYSDGEHEFEELEEEIKELSAYIKIKKYDFTHFSNLPAELRMMVVEEMKPDDRCRFRRCSVTSLRESRLSKKYIYGLRFNQYSEKHLSIHVIHCPQYRNRPFGGYVLNYSESKKRKYLRCNIPYEGAWEKHLKKSTSLVNSAIKQFNKLLKFYQNKIKTLEVFGAPISNFGIRSMNNLEILKIYNHHDFQYFASIIQHRLKTLSFYPPLRDSFPINCEQYCYQVQENFESDNLKITYEQLLNFSAKRMKMYIGDLTPINISDFISCWRNGTIWKNFKNCQWDVNNSDFDMRQFLDILRIQNFERQRTHRFIARFNIKHEYEKRKVAKLVITWADGSKSILFDVTEHE